MIGLRLLGLLCVGALAACATPRVSDTALEEDGIPGPVLSGQHLQTTAAQLAALRLFNTPETVRQWEPFVLPGKTFARFDAANIQGRPALKVAANRSLSILRQQMRSAPVHAGRLAFS